MFTPENRGNFASYPGGVRIELDSTAAWCFVKRRDWREVGIGFRRTERWNSLHTAEPFQQAFAHGGRLPLPASYCTVEIPIQPCETCSMENDPPVLDHSVIDELARSHFRQ